MKNYRVDGFKFALFPVIIIWIMVIYGLVFFNGTPMVVNVLNLGVDIILLIIYFRLFVYDINLDSQGITLKGLLIEKRILVSDMKSLKQGGVLTLIKTEKGRFFILSFKSDKETIKNIFKDV
ncbi:MAG: hypothetical protein RR645_00235 [Clostridium sp.]